MKNITFLILSFFLAIFGHAQEANFYAEVSANETQVGQRITLTFQLENASGRITPPNLPAELAVIFGPSQSQNYSNINGKSSVSVSLRYVITPRQEGTFTIGSASSVVNGKSIKTTPIQIKVGSGASQNTNNSTSQASAAPSNATPKNTENSNILLDVSANKTSAFVNEAVTLTYTLYSRYNRLQPTEIKMPAPTNFWVEDIKLENRNWDPNLAVINGQQYRKIIMAQRVVYPQKSGTLSTGIAEIDAVVNAGFFSQGEKLSAASDDFTIKVKALPNPVPADFTGFTGKLNASANTSKDSGSSNEAITFTLKLSGEGNFKLLNAPKIAFPDDFEVYEPKVKNNYRLNYGGYKGSLEIEYLLIPRFAGEYEIPSIELSYFDLDSKSFKKAKSNAKTIRVKGNSNNKINGNLQTSVDKNAVDNINTDIRYISTSTPKNDEEQFLQENTAFTWGIRIALKLAFIAGLLFIKKREDLIGDTLTYKSSKAAKKAIKALTIIKKKKNQEDYSAIYRAYTIFLSEKFGIELSGMTKASIENSLLKQQIPAEKISETVKIIERCEMASFAPNSASNYNELLQQSEKNIKQLA